ncbi:hypothetical protein, partial [Amycolatopsis magusensis]|uniref:hypothetical protein n=1 Tax=Amycolatopsis magusensis TaxID=882444 RepID=UPI0024A83B44
LGNAPCIFYFILISSRSRGEAIAYSDIEYMLVIDLPYGCNSFEREAIDNYFRKFICLFEFFMKLFKEYG